MSGLNEANKGMAPPYPKLFVLILNTNRKDDTLECLKSLAASDYPSQTVLVLDNASTDGSSEAIRGAFPSVEVVALEKNLGYAGNNNVGIALALERGADWVLVLNEDTIVDAGCLTALIEAGTSSPDIGAVGPLVFHHDEPDIIQSAGGALDGYMRSWHLGQNEKDRGQYSQTRDTAWVSGCAICVRADAIRQVGMIDESFFYYWEETEWCVRIGKGGWRIQMVPAARLWHKGVQRDYRPGPNIAYYNTRNRFLILSRSHADAKAWGMAYAETFRTLAAMSVKPGYREQRAARNAIWQGIVDFHTGTLGKRPESSAK